MSCRCITPFSLLNAYTGLTGRSDVSTVSRFKNEKGCLWWCAAPVLSLIPTYSYSDKLRFTLMAVALSISFLEALPRPGSSTFAASVLGFPCCPAWCGPLALAGTPSLCLQRVSWLIGLHLLMQCTFLTFSGKAIVEPSRNSYYWKPIRHARRAASCGREDERQR